MKSIFKLFIGFLLMIGTGFAFASSYTIKHGDTLSAIALAHKTTIVAIMALNPSIVHPNEIFAGHKLTIPATVAQVSIPLARTSIIALPKQEVRAVPQLTERVSSCAPLRVIERLGYPNSVAEALGMMVRKDLSDRTDALTLAVERRYTADTKDTSYTLTITPNCTFAKSERAHDTDTLAHSATDTPETSGSDTAHALLSPSSLSVATTRLEHLEQGTPSANPRQALKEFLQEAIGPPYDVEPIIEAMVIREQLSQWGVTLN